MSSKQYRGIRSSVRKTKSEARRMFEARQEQLKSLSARNIKAKPLKNSVKDGSHPPMPDRAVRIVPLKKIGTLVQQLPDTPITRKGMTLRQLMTKTPALMRNNSDDVQIETLSKKKTKSGLPVVVAKGYTVDPFRPKATRRVHELYIVGLDSQSTPISKQRRVLVSCSCENYCFVFEYANAYHGASKILYGNGQSPDFTNPGLLPGLCKHLYSLAEIVRERGM